ncbi:MULTISPECIES: potassium-transporting ATPase subunit KdpA [unclassified Mycolicibacterium]|uniref:potassium-transporting ATPase subunit KdpA n=1 Tax=unclassified Mycolicibacterium TaxID=2636767 RepID=UPI00130783C7|nr:MULTISPECIES: potassium-transporting ATPase subunit KdpA [unclassified Mycolicibacterium]MUL85245.1 potassium-transporting ATPase subunit KdpA [Mycolicibacterium sp. CBMA 329]MUL91212.1 potassium-transporting ATPase subunit KdpA [Mycolicibacterium sp. CBMA 331]MUL98119.1 potassium-transporting ATPase subunit KdpA [Mycolicibacterium sp. CBMA 334]MUM25781.1 potassium-transporting ATPase subunit KdpA [Mycolicibacterium sp. CBMA 295]MUM40971.1 potassium-transporting ATPase subunit KdpA [Mycolic
MTTTTAGIIFLAVLIVAVAAIHVPLGDYMYRVYTAEKHSRAERVIYRLIGADPKAEQTWGAYARSVLAFSAISILFLFILQLVQGRLPLHLNDPATPMTPALAWNTAVSFVTNTNWQAYSGETTQGHLVQMAGLAVQNFVSAAVGMAVAVALVRGLVRRSTGDLGNFWMDLVRGTIRILLPISIIGAIVLTAGGAIQNFDLHTQAINTLVGGTQTIPGGPVASQEVIKLLGTNGGGFFNANSAHPFENPATWTNWVEIFLILMIPFSLPRTFGRMVGSPKQGFAIASVMAVIATISVTLIMLVQLQAHGTVPTAAGSAMEGVEQRFGVADSAVFADMTTLTSTGAVDSFHDSYTSLGGMITMFNMQLGEVAPGGVGSGLYGMLILAIITVFVAGLMVGRTPEYLGKKITPREIKLAATYFLVTPLIALTGTAVAMAMPDQRAGMLNTGPHGLSEVLYAFTSAANNNGSAFAGISVNTEWYNTALGLAMVFGRFLPIIFVLALAGSLAKQGKTPESIGTLPTHRPQFVGMVAGVTLILVALTFLPMLALGPLAEGIH